MRTRTDRVLPARETRIDPADPLNPRSNPSPDGLEFTFGTVQTEGAVGTTSVAPRSPARIFVTLAQEISLHGLMPDTGTLLFHRTARMDWTAEYRPLDKGEQSPASAARRTGEAVPRRTWAGQT